MRHEDGGNGGRRGRGGSFLALCHHHVSSSSAFASSLFPAQQQCAEVVNFTFLSCEQTNDFSGIRARSNKANFIPAVANIRTEADKARILLTSDPVILAKNVSFAKTKKEWS